jgi:hypothetical protein
MCDAVCLLAALQFACDGTLYGVTTTRTLVTVDTTTGAPTTVCTFSSSDALRIIAFIDRTRIAHFYGSANPVMELLSTTSLGSRSCNAVRVSAFTTAAKRLFQGAPVLAATLDPSSDPRASRLLVVAGSPPTLYTVTAAGDVTAVGVLKAADNAVLSTRTLAFTNPRLGGHCE